MLTVKQIVTIQNLFGVGSKYVPMVDAMRDEELFAMHPCVNTVTVRMSNRDFMDKVIPAMGHEPIFAAL